VICTLLVVGGGFSVSCNGEGDADGKFESLNGSDDCFL
jgi:hypothetical protein